jgi:small subunit ribosomal protein S18
MSEEINELSAGADQPAAQPAEAPAEAPAATATPAAPAPAVQPATEGTTPYRRPPPGVKRFQRRKVCAFCVEKLDYIDYKDMKRIRKFVSERGKILPRRISGNCATHQRMLTVALKRARNIALVPFRAE